MRHRILSSVIMILLSMISWGQSQHHKLPEPQMTTTDGGGAPPPPPPPGLSIDLGAPGLIAAGLALGIYFLRPKKILRKARSFV